MNKSYQLIIAGHNNDHIEEIKGEFLLRVKELGVNENIISFVDESNFKLDYQGNKPSICLYFGRSEDGQFKNLDILKKLRDEAVFVIPVVSNLKKVAEQIPDEIITLNAFLLEGAQNVSSLVNRVMEGLSLLRQTRRLFISYRRVESRVAAVQLYEHLDACGYDVFLDTHSIKPGEIFQEELWHRLVDTDVVVLLNTPEFLQSRWTKEELAQASSMSIGVIQLIYPNHIPPEYAALCFPFYLGDSHFAGKNYKIADALFSEKGLTEIENKVEEVRARSLAARQDNIIEEFTKTAEKKNITAVLHSEKFIIVENRGRLFAVIPTIGVPHAFTYNQTAELIKIVKKIEASEAILLYDDRNIREKWLNHLAWLNTYLPIKAEKITQVDNWMDKIS